MLTAKTLIRLRGSAGWFESLLGARVQRYVFSCNAPPPPQHTHTHTHTHTLLITCAFYSLQVIRTGIKEKPCHIVWMYRLIWIFAGHTGLIVGFVVRWLIYKSSFWTTTFCCDTTKFEPEYSISYEIQWPPSKAKSEISLRASASSRALCGYPRALSIFKRTSKTLISLCIRAGWSDSSLGADASL